MPIYLIKNYHFKHPLTSTEGPSPLLGTCGNSHVEFTCKIPIINFVANVPTLIQAYPISYHYEQAGGSVSKAKETV